MVRFLKANLVLFKEIVVYHVLDLKRINAISMIDGILMLFIGSEFDYCDMTPYLPQR